MGTCSSVPSESSLSQVLWKTFGAVPVLSSPKLKVFSVLVKENGSFWRIGDLGSLCAQGEAKAFLQHLIARGITVSQQLGCIDHLLANDIRLSSKFLLLQKGFSAGLNDVHAWRIHVPSHQCSYADEEILDKMLEGFVPDTRNRHFAGSKKLDVWIVTEVITAPSVSVYSLDRRGANIGLSWPPLAPLPLDLQATLDGEGGSALFFNRSGAEVDGTVRPLPLAFRGWKYTYQNGILKNPRRARYESDSDSFQSPPLNGAPERLSPHARAATPLNDPDMVDFVVEDEWVTTILDDEDL